RMAQERAERIAYIANMNLIQREWEATPIHIGRVLEILEETRTFQERGFEWGYWNRLCHQEIRTLKGHKGKVISVAFSPDGKRIATGSFDRTAKIWDSETGKEIFTLKGHTGAVTSVAFSPDGRRIATGSFDSTARVWDASTGQEALILK